MFIHRMLDLPALLKKKSFFLFGPRATGKTSLIRAQFPASTPIINLLKTEQYLALSERPQDLEPLIQTFDHANLVVIDEVQKIPMLLNEVHRLIEEAGIRFLLTGSSARTLKTQHVNLLAGRAWEAQLFPFVSAELPDFNLGRYLQFGGLPPVYLSEHPQEELIAYSNTYLREEVQAESLVRKIPAFSRFLQMAAVMSGKILNFSEVASDTAIPASTIREYYQILQDTFIGFIVPPWAKTVKRKARSTAKFYFFDIGVRNALAGVKKLNLKSDEFGQCFEHFILLELRAYLSYTRRHTTLSYWQDRYGHEVDAIIGDEIAIKIKATQRVTDKHLKGLRLLQQEGTFTRYLLVSQDPIPRQYGDITLLPWQDFLTQLWQGRLFDR